MKLRNVNKENTIEITGELWNLNVENGDSENLKRRGTIERETRVGEKGEE